MSDVDYSADVSSADTAAAPPTQADAGEAAPVSEVGSLPASETVSQDELLSQVYRELNAPDEPGRQYHRDESGRFAQKQIDQAQNAAMEQQNAAIQPPHSWSAEAKAAWSQVPPELQQVIAQRDIEAQQALSRQGQEIGEFRHYANIWEHGRQAFGQLGWNSDEQALSELIGYAMQAVDDPIGAIVRVAEARGIDLYQALGVTPQHGVSPDLAAIYAQNSELQRRMDNFQRQVEMRERSEEEARLSAIQERVVEFSRDKPDFERQAPAILQAIGYMREQYPQASPDEWLQWAYDAVQWAMPDTREQLMQQHWESQEKARVAEAQKRAKEARNGQALHVKSSPANMANPKSQDDLLKETYRRLNST